MQIMDIRDRLRRGISERMGKISDDTVRGSAGDFAEYRRLCGRHQGLRDALEVVDAVFKKLIDDQDE